MICKRLVFLLVVLVGVLCAWVGVLPASATNCALRFNGGQHAIVGPVPQFDGADVTVEAWFRPLGLPPQEGMFVWNGDGNGAHDPFVLEMRADGRLRAMTDLNTSPNTHRWIDSDASVALGQWHHVAFVVCGSGGPAWLMVDGNRQNSTLSISGGPVIGTSFMAFGALHDVLSWAPLWHYTGELDEVRVWGLARSEEDIRSDMYRPLQGNEPGLLGYWSFDECAGQTARDLGPYGKDATLGQDSSAESVDPTWVAAGAPLSSGPSCSMTYTPTAPTIADTIVVDSHAADPVGTITSVAWDFGDGNTGTGLTATHSYAAAGSYTVTATVTNDSGASASCSASLAVTGLQIVLQTDTTWRAIAPVGNLEGAPIDSVGLQWEAANPGWNTNPAFDDSHWSNAVYPFAGCGPDDIWIAGGALSADTPCYFRRTLTVPGPVLSATVNPFCVDDDAIMYVNGQVAIYNADRTATCTGPVDVTHLFTAGTNLIAVKAQDSYGGRQSLRLTITVEFGPPPPTCAIAYAPAAPEVTETVAFNSNAAGPEGSVASVTWSFGDGGTATGLTTSHAYDDTGTYTVTCTVTDDDGLTGTCSASVTVVKPTRVSLPTQGWYLIAQPHHGNHALSSVRVRRVATGEELAYCDAWLAGWVQADVYWYDHDDPGYKNCSCDLWSDDDTLRQGRGYWVCTEVDGLALVFP